MWFARLSGSAMFLFVAALFLSSTGCSKDDKGGQPTKDGQAQNKDDKKGEKDKKDHSEWWCQEHGIPEHLCSLCKDDVAAKLRKEGDWCKLHDRAKSQCFKCDPTKYAKFEEMYVAKYGKKPERPPKEEFEK